MIIIIIIITITWYLISICQSINLYLSLYLSIYLYNYRSLSRSTWRCQAIYFVRLPNPSGIQSFSTRNVISLNHLFIKNWDIIYFISLSMYGSSHLIIASLSLSIYVCMVHLIIAIMIIASPAHPSAGRLAVKRKICLFSIPTFLFARDPLPWEPDLVTSPFVPVLPACSSLGCFLLLSF